jgi:serine/threonine protein kinase
MSETLTWSRTTPPPLDAAPRPAPDALGSHDALSPGTRLDEFEIIRVLGVGGFGIVYLALDNVLLRFVAIKEYMPTALAGRSKGATVSVRSSTLAETFAMGLASFFNEARLLASFDHPSLVKVYRFWKANGTGYMAMQYYPGQTLKEARRGMSASPDEAWLRAFVEPLLGALEVLHGEGVYHRDISPDNILLLPDGRPVLLDFGSARRLIGDRTQSLTAILKPNFAPVEQYADEAGMRQGPWTDVYALGATVHFMLTGQAPTPAVMRAVRDVLPALSAPGCAPFPGVSTGFLAAIDWTLALAPDDRPQSVASVRLGLSGEVVPPPPSQRHAAVPRFETEDDSAASEPACFDPAAAGPAAEEIVPASLLAAARTATPRSRGTRATLAILALTGLSALGLGAWALGPSAPVPAEAASPAALTVVPTAIVAPAPPPTRTAAPVAAPAPRVVRSTAAVVPHSRPTAAVAESTRVAAPVVTPHQRSAEASAASVRPATDAAPRSPKAACGDRNFFALAMCVSRQCQAPHWREHPQCVEIRYAEEQRQRRVEQ